MCSDYEKETFDKAMYGIEPAEHITHEVRITSEGCITPDRSAQRNTSFKKRTLSW